MGLLAGAEKDEDFATSMWLLGGCMAASALLFYAFPEPGADAAWPALLQARWKRRQRGGRWARMGPEVVHAEEGNTMVGP